MVQRYKIGLGMLLGIWVISCSPAVPNISATSNPIVVAQATPSPAPQFRGQMLPISAQATIAGKTINLEVTRTPEQQALGLMYRTALPDDRGMLFEFYPPQPVSFWMKNVKIPLDMIFLRQGVVRAIASAVPPCNTNPCPTYGPNTPIDQVIELRGGRAAQLGLRVGDRVTVRFLSNSSPR